MRLTKILLCSAAAAAFTFAVPVSGPVNMFLSPAQAATDVSISFGTFYDDLAPHGSWTQYRDAYVFIPAGVNGDWRPYTVGHWAYTERYGWFWVSDEPFGWATYHYGRWGYDDDIGWYWIPGRRWAPAWVSWRRSADYVVWAPLPPEVDDDISVTISVSDIPERYWVAVPSRSFLETDLSVLVIDDDHERVRVVEAADPVGNVRIENNVVVNNAIDVDYVRRETKRDVKTVKVKDTDDPRQSGKSSDGEVSAFTGEVSRGDNMKPKEVKKVEEVKKNKGAQSEKVAPAESPDTGQAEQQPQQGQKQQRKSQAGEEQQPVKRKKPAGNASQPLESPAPATTEVEQPAKKKKSSKAAAQPEPPVKKKSSESTDQPQQQVKRKKQPQVSEEQQQLVKRKLKGTEQPQMRVEQLQGAQKLKPIERPKAKESEPRGKVPKGGCDPASGEGCAQ
ncbi:hypothetical protein G5V57_25750 [Nordella sp. HKS 07]|uniref:DUF6600 domain-containing protein n=1 Tax=Nordella sp. HKS 07 TaxID=2712222 RepID=UPI0013E13EBA|nr:DUF6600 domain-containing protein [Nordella sp. HKS 07]QIG50837.1 hypothetical protein G5V57_25750 [Nordella sp. HKS 07]